MTSLLLLFFSLQATAQKKVSTPIPIPGLEDTFLAPDIIEIRVYFGIAAIVVSLGSFIALQFLSALNKRLEKSEEKQELILSMLNRFDERQKHLPTRDEVRTLVREEVEHELRSQ